MSKLIKKEKISQDMTFEKDDKLNRKSIAENFNLLLNETSQPFVIALDSPWGTGKTQFIYMWRNLLKENSETIYINLWEEDFLQSPFFSLTEAFFDKFEEKNIGESETRKELKNIGWQLGKAAVSKVFNLDLDNLVNEDYNKTQRKNKEKFKNNLKELAKKVKEDTDFPLIIFVDELDRCRPNYAIEFLEITKHFFDVENVIFILGIDAEQLQHSIKSLYGEGMDAKGYIRKFIDINYSFSTPPLENYLEFLFSEFKCGNKQCDQVYTVKEMLKKFNPSLREINNLFTRLNLIEGNIHDSYIQASFFLALKIFKEKEYNRIINNSFQIEEIISLIKYFETSKSNFGKIVFWKIANDLILRASHTEKEYMYNLKIFFSKFLNEEYYLKRILSTADLFMDTHFSTQYIKGIFIADPNLQKEENNKIISSIFNSKEGHLREFVKLIQKIDFLEGLDFSKEKKDETTNTNK